MKNKHTPNRKNKKWPAFYAVLFHKTDASFDEAAEDLDYFTAKAYFLQKLMEQFRIAKCRCFFSRRNQCWVFYRDTEWSLNLNTDSVFEAPKVQRVGNRCAAYLEILKHSEGSYELLNPETGEPCTLEEFCAAEARRSDS